MKKGFFAIALLLAGVAVFEFYPAVEQGRNIVPEEIYVGKDCGCDCILGSRPWYSTFNYWFWFWIIATPVIIFSVKPAAPKWQRALRTLVAIGFCYGVMNLALHLMWDIRNGPFVVSSDPNFPDQKTWDMPGCANIADGASMVFYRYFAWFPASIYIGWGLISWKRYHRHWSETITDDFKDDLVSKIVAIFSKIMAPVVFVCAGLLLFLTITWL